MGGHRSDSHTLLFGFVQFLFGDVQIVHIGSVMFRMVKLHDFGRDNRLQRVEVIRQVRQSVLGSRIRSQKSAEESWTS